MAKQDEYVRYTIRVPTSLYDLLKDAAGEKSVNAEIVDRLEGTFGSDDKVALQAENEALKVTLDMLEHERRKLAGDLRELRKLREEMDMSEGAARDYFLQKYEGAFRMISKLYAASTYDRNHKAQLHDLLEEAGVPPDLDQLRQSPPLQRPSKVNAAHRKDARMRAARPAPALRAFMRSKATS